jgi:ArsR family transcriptional regulator
VATPEGEGALVQLLLDVPLSEPDHHALERLRADRTPLAADLGPDYLPGRSWEALARLLLALLPPLDIADIGVGTGQLTRLLASRARRLVAVDLDAEALASLPPTIETRVGRLEAPPLERDAFDLVVLSQSLHCVDDPIGALAACLPALRSGGTLAVLDLAPHGHDWVRHRLGHRHLGFADLGSLLTNAGFVDVQHQVAHRDRKAPSFTTILALGRRP